MPSTAQTGAAAGPDIGQASRETRERVATACAVLFRLGLTDYLGHPSMRVPGTEYVAIKPRHSEAIRAMGSIQPDEVAVIDLDGKLVAGTHHPPGERFIHTGIYRARPDVSAVVHTHQSLATIFGVVQKEILPILHVEAPLVARGIPTYPSPELIEDAERGAAVAAALGDYDLCHLQGHGIVTVAKTVEEATIAAIHLERLARANYMAAQIGGTPRVIPTDEIERLHAPMVGYKVRWAYYTSLVEDRTLPANW
ncbi:MAG: class II aldolase/adducin family protein [Chloroflexi bacterium]|nr:class II aldolase/adducin family protein [Chloroflexota bacterium]